MDKGVVHTGDLIFPWQKGIRQDAEADSQQKTRNFEISGGQRQITLFFRGRMKKSASNNQKQKTLAIIKSIHQAAQIFDSKLVGKTFLYVYEGKAIEVVYRASDFLHLTGVDTALTASAFYRNAKAGKLSTEQIFFSARHPYDLCKRDFAKHTKLTKNFVEFEHVTINSSK